MTIAQRLAPYGTSVFTEITRLAMEHQAVNLGQGFPDFDGPEFIKDAVIDAIRAGRNQYARSFGVAELNQAIADRMNRHGRLRVDPTTNVTVTSGCTEAIAATMLGLLNPGDEVVLFEPYYDSYPACIAMAGATPRFVTLRTPDFKIDRASLEAAFTSRTRAILINTPHNPTGKVFSVAELELIAELAQKHDTLVLTDEVYEDLVFEGEHIRIATLPGMWERTITLGSLGKSFSFTGWKIGWAIAPPELSAGIRASHQFLTFCAATPIQYGAVAALGAGDEYYERFRAEYRVRRDLLVDGLARLGFNVFVPQGTYFVLADHTPFGFSDDLAFCRHLIEHAGVAAIPPSSFYQNHSEGRKLVRFAFCKKEETLREAVQRMSVLRS